MGTILRTCSWFGCYNIIINKECVEIYNPKTVRSGMGAHFHITSFFNHDNEKIIKFFKDNQYKIYSASLSGEPIENLKIKDKKWALILGNESRGISKYFEKNSQKIHIKGKGKMESLNVAEAASIVIHYLSKI